MTKSWRNYDWMVEHYIDKEMTIRQMAKLAGCSFKCIQVNLIRMGIKMRSKGCGMVPKFKPKLNSPLHESNEPEIKEVISRPKINIGY